MADLGGGQPRHAPPYGPKFSQFRAVFRKIWQNHILAPPPPHRGLVPPPMGNPGSAPDLGIVCCVFEYYYISKYSHEYHWKYHFPNIIFKDGNRHLGYKTDAKNIPIRKKIGLGGPSLASPRYTTKTTPHCTSLWM